MYTLCSNLMLYVFYISVNVKDHLIFTKATFTSFHIHLFFYICKCSITEIPIISRISCETCFSLFFFFFVIKIKYTIKNICLACVYTYT